ncbi:MAG: metallophosphoesterase [Bacilli bacterium]|nr:metallophosphoesterase [Bacilli bacterium]
MKIITEQYCLKSEKVKKNIIIALIADLHYIGTTEYSTNIDIMKAVLNMKPNYICICGDFFGGFGTNNFENKKVMNILLDLLEKLKKIAPVILSLGNHDLTIRKDKELRKLFKQLKSENIYPLDNESVEFEDCLFSGFYASRKSYAISKISKRKSKMIVKDWNKSDFKPSKNKYNILCHHLPDTLYNKTIKDNISNLFDYDIVLSGHTHNGSLSEKYIEKRNQKIDNKILKAKSDKIRVQLEKKKYYGFCESIINFPPFLRKVSRGMHYVNGTNLIISKGITSGIKFIIKDKIVFDISKNFPSYITQIKIEPVVKMD